MTEDERKVFNGLVAEVLILRLALLDLYRSVHGEKSRDRLAALFAGAFPDSPGDPEEMEKLTEYTRAAKRLLVDIRDY